MRGKTCLITGANGGLGKATSIGLAKLGARVIMVARDKEKGEMAKQEVISKSGNKNIDLMIADLGSLASVRKLARQVNSKYKKLDILINNAGIFVSGLKHTQDGIETQFQVNYLSHFLLTILLTKSLEKSGSGRVVNIASRAHKRIKGIEFEDIYFEKEYESFKAYAQSKLAIVMSTYEMARRLKSKHITVNCLHPGGVSTGIGARHASNIYSLIWKIAKPFLAKPSDAAKYVINIAVSEEWKNVTGKYFFKCRIRESSKASHNLADTKRLWKLSMRLVGLKDKKI